MPPSKHKAAYGWQDRDMALVRSKLKAAFPHYDDMTVSAWMESQKPELRGATPRAIIEDGGLKRVLDLIVDLRDEVPL